MNIFLALLLYFFVLAFCTSQVDEPSRNIVSYIFMASILCYYYSTLQQEYIYYHKLTS